MRCVSSLKTLSRCTKFNVKVFTKIQKDKYKHFPINLFGISKTFLQEVAHEGVHMSVR